MSGGWRDQAMLIAILIMVAGAGMMAYGSGPAVMFIGGFALAGLIVERIYRGPSNRSPVASNWRATDERFTDPATGKPTRVWFDPSTGERHYVADDARGR